MSSQVVESVDATLIDVPLRRPHKVSVTSIDHQSAVIVRLRTASGIEGIGEAVVPGGPWWSGESIEGIYSLIDRYLGPMVVGQDADRIQQIIRLLDRTIAGGRFAKAAVEMALWDVRGKALNVPAYTLLGGLCRDSIPVTWAIGSEPADAVIAEIENKLDAGLHSSFKLKMGSSAPAEDTERIRSVAKVFADRTSLRVDLNGSWDELTATRWLPLLEEAGIELIEQPVPAWNTAALQQLSERLTIPVMLDESLHTPQNAAALTQQRAGDLFAVKIAKSGGLSAVQRIATIAETADIGCHGGTTIETTLGTAANAHLFCATPGVNAGSELFGPLLLDEDITTEPLNYTDGHVTPPHGPGLGVTLDEKKIARFQRT